MPLPDRAEHSSRRGRVCSQLPILFSAVALDDKSMAHLTFFRRYDAPFHPHPVRSTENARPGRVAYGLPFDLARRAPTAGDDDAIVNPGAQEQEGAADAAPQEAGGGEQHFEPGGVMQWCLADQTHQYMDR